MISEALGIIEKFIPNKDERLKAEIELQKLFVKDQKNKLGSKMEKILYLTFPLLSWLLSLSILVNIILGVYCFIKGKPAVWVNIDDRHWQVVTIYLVGYFGGNNIKKWKQK